MHARPAGQQNKHGLRVCIDVAELNPRHMVPGGVTNLWYFSPAGETTIIGIIGMIGGGGASGGGVVSGCAGGGGETFTMIGG